MDFFFIPLFIGLGFLFINSFKSSLSKYDITTLQRLFVYHLIFGTYYCFFVAGDAAGYWNASKSMSFEDSIYNLTQEQGTFFICALNYFPSNSLGLSYFTGTMLYSLLGFIGLTYFYILAKDLVPYNSKFRGYYLFPFLFYLPNLHFWSCAVGKDTLLFLCIAFFMYGIMKPFKRIPMLALALLLSYFIRPHITFFLLVSFSLVYVNSTKASVFQRIVFLGLMIGLSVTILPSVMEFAKIEETTIDSFEQFSETKSSVLSRANVGSAIDISSYPFPLKVFTFLYRPLFFDINGIPAVLASFENLLLLVLSIKVLRNKPLLTFRKAPFVIQGMIFFLIIGTLAFSQSLGNLGIMIRMRNMFLPGLLIFILWSFSYQYQLSQEEKRKMS
ncbi:hypothetical protein [Flavobacterium terrisoli]|uniref:hypothetical protein n=1 Tax=Flavobacterium terrisoli TaxID=3242195 RepID=UPI002543253A|nr:hypothetical protein [Flavobacterium buctense]